MHSFGPLIPHTADSGTVMFDSSYWSRERWPIVIICKRCVVHIHITTYIEIQRIALITSCQCTVPSIHCEIVDFATHTAQYLCHSHIVNLNVRCVMFHLSWIVCLMNVGGQFVEFHHFTASDILPRILCQLQCITQHRGRDDILSIELNTDR